MFEYVKCTLNLINMRCFVDRRGISDLKFLYKSVDGFRDCSELVYLLNLYVLQRQNISSNTFFIQNHITSKTIINHIHCTYNFFYIIKEFHRKLNNL